MKETFGKPRSLMENMLYTLGLDYIWWLIPTKPILKINYLERLYTIKQLNKLTKEEDFEEEEYDEKKLMLKSEKEKSKRDKQIWGLVGLFCVNVWLIWGRHET